MNNVSFTHNNQLHNWFVWEHNFASVFSCPDFMLLSKCRCIRAELNDFTINPNIRRRETVKEVTFLSFWRAYLFTRTCVVMSIFKWSFLALVFLGHTVLHFSLNESEFWQFSKAVCTAVLLQNTVKLILSLHGVEPQSGHFVYGKGRIFCPYSKLNSLHKY